MRVGEKPKEKNKPCTSRKMAGVAVGAAIGISPFAIGLNSKLTILPDEKIIKLKRKVEKETSIKGASFEMIKNYADEIILKTGLKDKGLRIEIITPESIKPSKPLPKNATLTEKIKYIKRINSDKIYSNGLNASFSPKRNLIRINNERLYSAVFHEIGHALNFHKDKFMNLVQNSRKTFAKSTPIIGIGSLIIALLHEKKSTQIKKSKNSTEKTKDFIHDNAGKLTFLTLVPTLIEEGMASIKGQKLAKPFLNAAQHKQHIKMLTLFSFGSYFKQAMIVSGAIAFGIFIKDKIVRNKKTN